MRKPKKIKFILDGGYIISAPRSMTVEELIGKFEEMHNMKSFKGINIPVSDAEMTDWKDEPANIVITDKAVRLVRD